ncbi:hypothetical protein CR513_37167, partial [Mucuna pruriens]
MKANREWMLFVDGSSKKRRSEVGVILEGPSGVLIEQSLCFRFQASNNQTKYETLLAGIRLTKELGAKNQREATEYVLIIGDRILLLTNPAMQSQSRFGSYNEVFPFLCYNVWGKLKRSELLKKFMREHVEAILIEVERVATISIERVRRLLAVIVSDNDTQFASWAVVEFCAYRLPLWSTLIEGINYVLSHTQSNKQVEATNKVILR